MTSEFGKEPLDCQLQGGVGDHHSLTQLATSGLKEQTQGKRHCAGVDFELVEEEEGFLGCLWGGFRAFQAE